jgi:DNA-binding NarL/FixJ family response regulator
MRIAIAEDHALFREGLVLQLARAGQEVVVEAGTGEELLVMTGQHAVDVAILDVRLPPTFADEGLRASEELAARSPGIAILL